MAGSGDNRRVVWEFEPEIWEWVSENLPAADAVHARVRPRYARPLAEVHAALEGKDGAEAAALATVEYLPRDPHAYYELGNATISIGLRGRHMADACYAAAKIRLREGDVEECKRLLRLHLRLLLDRDAPHISADRIDTVTADTDLD
jgi:hypothetical protein